jgi:ATP-dependent Lhr-like helicase
VDEEYKLEGPRGLTEIVRQLAGFEIPAAAWEASVLSARLRDFRREWLDELTLLGDVTWGRLWGGGATAIRTTPITLIPRDELESWTELAGAPAAPRLSGAARDIHDVLSARGPLFAQELQRLANLLWGHLEMGLAELIAQGMLTCDSFAGLRQLITPPSKRSRQVRPAGRWSLFRTSGAFRLTPDESETSKRKSEMTEFIARRLLLRTGVVFRRTILKEKQPVPWYELVRTYRRMELRGEVRGGRFVAGFSGEQYALPEAVELLRKTRRRGVRPPVDVPAADPLNFQGILTPEPRIAPTTRARVRVG